MSAVDRSGVSIEVKLTDRCNQHCSHCMNDDGARRSGALDVSLLILRLRELGVEAGPGGPGIDEVRVTGGEPLLELEALLELADACRALGIRCGINTNATLLDAGVAERLVFAGLSTVKVSLDAIEEGLYAALRGQRGLSCGLTGAAVAVAAGLDVTLRFTLSKDNLEQLGPCYLRACELGARRFQVKPLIPAGRGSLLDTVPSPTQVADAVRKLSLLGGGSRTEIQVLCCAPAATPGLRVQPCASLGKIYIATDGQVFVCNYLRDDTSLGDLRRDSLGDLLRRQLSKRRVVAAGHEVLAGCAQWEPVAPAEGPVLEAGAACATPCAT